MRVLAVGAHPDDCEVFCGGTLAKFAAQGAEVVICHAGNGNMGHYIIQPDELRRIRRKEAIAAAEVIGAESVTLDLDDGLHFVDKETVLKHVEMIRRAKPDLIITHPPEDYMPDHVATSNLVMHASFDATLPHLETGSPGLDSVVPVYFMEAAIGLDFTPAEFVDISEHLETKLRMVKCHDSQVSWLRDHSKYDMEDAVTTYAKYRGYQCGVKYAEAFRPADKWLRRRAARLLP